MNSLKYLPVLGILALSACTFPGQKPQTPVPTPPATSLTGNILNNKPPALTGATQTPPAMVIVEAGKTKYIPLVLVDGKSSLKIQSWTGSMQYIRFNSTGAKTLKVSLKTPLDAKGNVQVTQIIAPDGTNAGPFGKEMTYTLTQDGTYRLVLSANMMSQEAWSWEVDVNVEVK